MVKLQRNRSEMVAPRLPTGRRTLLPVELELIQALNLSENEYWHFVDKTESQNGKRPKGYELIPDIQNQNYVIQFAIALVVGYIQQKMAPKPRAPKKPPSLTTADVSNEKRFAPPSLALPMIFGVVISMNFCSRNVFLNDAKT